MVTDKEIYENDLRDGKDYIYIGGLRLRKGDKFLCNGKEVVIKEILDQVHFLDKQYCNCWHSHMFYDRKCEHVKEKETQELEM